MILTLSLSCRVPGKPLTVDGEAKIDMMVLEAKPDKAAFLVMAVERLRQRVTQEVVSKTKEAEKAPSHD